MTNCCNHEEQSIFQIRLNGSLDESWSDWFDGMTVATQSGETTITGKMDQSTLRGVLNKIWDLNLALISVKRIAQDTAPSLGRSKPVKPTSVIGN